MIRTEKRTISENELRLELISQLVIDSLFQSAHQFEKHSFEKKIDV